MHFGTFTPPEPAGPRYATDACAANDLSKRNDDQNFIQHVILGQTPLMRPLWRSLTSGKHTLTTAVLGAA
jgi:hypothetical protein